MRGVSSPGKPSPKKLSPGLRCRKAPSPHPVCHPWYFLGPSPHSQTTVSAIGFVLEPCCFCWGPIPDRQNSRALKWRATPEQAGGLIEATQPARPDAGPPDRRTAPLLLPWCPCFHPADSTEQSASPPAPHIILCFSLIGTTSCPLDLFGLCMQPIFPAARADPMLGPWCQVEGTRFEDVCPCARLTGLCSGPSGWVTVQMAGSALLPPDERG